jgi:GNAT superfamily N-acetyltransferase
MAEPDPSAGGTAVLSIAAVGVPPVSGTASGPGQAGVEFRECHALRVAHEMAVWGNLDRCPTLPEALEYWRGNEYEERHLYLASLGSETVGMCSVTLPLRENFHTAGIDVLIAPARRRQGLGRALLEHAEAVARNRGRTSLDAYHEVPLRATEGTALLPAKSGAGGLPLDEPAVAFAVAAGYELEQVERSSRLELPVPPDVLDRLEADASPRAADYTITGWDDTCPEDLVQAYARLKETMSTDVPLAGLDWEREDWDAARVHEEEQALIRGGVQSAVTAAVHTSTGRTGGLHGPQLARRCPGFHRAAGHPGGVGTPRPAPGHAHQSSQPAAGTSQVAGGPIGPDMECQRKPTYAGHKYRAWLQACRF